MRLRRGGQWRESSSSRRGRSCARSGGPDGGVAVRGSIVGGGFGWKVGWICLVGCCGAAGSS